MRCYTTLARQQWCQVWLMRYRRVEVPADVYWNAHRTTRRTVPGTRLQASRIRNLPKRIKYIKLEEDTVAIYQNSLESSTPKSTVILLRLRKACAFSDRTCRTWPPTTCVEHYECFKKSNPQSCQEKIRDRHGGVEITTRAVAVWYLRSMKQESCIRKMWHQYEKNNRKGANMGTSILSSRRPLNGGVMTFVTLLLFVTIATLVWNYEGVQRLVKLVPTDGFYSGVKHPLSVLTPKPSKENETSTGSDSLKEEVAADIPLNIPSLQPLVVNLTILKGAVAKGAVCLDGSPPGYHLHKGKGVNARNWVVFLEEGAWCESEAACRLRARAHLGSSKWMNVRTFEGILSNSEKVNPDFYNWNRVFVRYCDGASFSGNATLPNKNKGKVLQYRGESIWNAVIDDLIYKKGMKNADKALLGGCSAGGLSSILHCDKFKAALPSANVVKCMSDAGFFVDMKTYKGENKIRTYFKNIVDLQNVSGTLPKYCTEKRNPIECFFPQYLLSQVKTPLFVVNGAYDWWQMDNTVAPDPLGEWDLCKNDATRCTDAQLSTIQGYRQELLDALKPIQKSKKHGMFIDGCFHHCQASYDAFWSGQHAPHVNGQTASQALGDWYFERDTKTNSVIDCAYPCNPTCPPKTTGALSVGRPSFRNWSKRG